MKNVLFYTVLVATMLIIGNKTIDYLFVEDVGNVVLHETAYVVTDIDGDTIKASPIDGSLQDLVLDAKQVGKSVKNGDNVIVSYTDNEVVNVEPVNLSFDK